MRSIIVLGSTSSIGELTLEVIRANPRHFRVVGLATDSVDEHAGARLNEQAQLFETGRTARGAEDTVRLVSDTACDVVVNASEGFTGLAATLAALKAGRTVALANKESLILGAELVTSAASPGQLVPVDSEHSALAQALRAGEHTEVKRLILTASGGPFLGYSKQKLRGITPEQALQHPTWNIGTVAATNSATLVNKGLEVIEAHLLFDVAYNDIEVVVHPQSIVQSMVEFVDGSTVAIAARPDMKLSISLALDWPNRVSGAVAPLDWTTAQRWQFDPLDEESFSAVRLAKRAGLGGGTSTAAFHAANEEAVAAFHDGRLSFTGIVDTIREVVEAHESAAELTLEAITEADRSAREAAKRVIARGQQ